TRRYVSARPLQGPVRAADPFREEPEHAHAPLVVMLVLTQASVGGFVADLAGRRAGLGVPAALAVFSLAVGLAGGAASLLPLGRPVYAYPALIRLRPSWLSREVAAFGLFAALALAPAAAALFRPALATTTATLAPAAGAAAVACSVMVYHAVKRPFWHAATAGAKFAGTAAVLGLAAALVAT